jgi:predicted membrane-bound mannosyltransferase
MEERPSSDKAFENDWRDALDRRGWIIYSALVLVGLFLRWFQLDDRPVFHDESLHAMYGLYFYDAPEVHYYQYNPSCRCSSADISLAIACCC